MRSYIFTQAERRLIERFLKGEIDAKDRGFHVIVSRVRHFGNLRADVDLYVRLCSRLAESETAKPA